MLEKRCWYLVQHTLGLWSHWAVLDEVKITIPSSDAEFHIWDVPGFGQQSKWGASEYRMSIVDSALKQSASTLLLCYAWDRSESANVRMDRATRASSPT